MSLEIKNLKKSFTDRVIFNDFSQKFENKGIYVIKGDSGVGKTTLLRIIAGLDKEYEGEVIGGGFSNISYAFQEYRLFEQLTAIENLLVVCPQNPTEDDERKAKELLKLLRFNDEDIKLFPRQLSGGMKQRISVARAIMKNSNILILDEPTKELDPELVEILCTLIRNEAEKRLVLLVTHDEDLAFENQTVINL